RAARPPPAGPGPRAGRPGCGGYRPGRGGRRGTWPSGTASAAVPGLLSSAERPRAAYPIGTDHHPLERVPRPSPPAPCAAPASDRSAAHRRMRKPGQPPPARSPLRHASWHPSSAQPGEADRRRVIGVRPDALLEQALHPEDRVVDLYLLDVRPRPHRPAPPDSTNAAHWLVFAVRPTAGATTACRTFSVKSTA